MFEFSGSLYYQEHIYLNNLRDRHSTALHSGQLPKIFSCDTAQEKDEEKLSRRG